MDAKGKPTGIVARVSGQDGWMLAVLVAAAVVIAWPLAGGGLALYLDNPPHLAEINAAAHDSHGGWSDDAWCGFPVGSLHSPLWYAPLVLFDRWGGNVDAFYFVMVLCGFLAPPLALYRVARRSLSPPVAGVLALVLLIQRPAVVGVGSAFGGMWTFYLATGFFILLVDDLARPMRGIPWPAAALTGLILLTHLFPVAPLALIGALAVLIPLLRGRSTWPRAVMLAGCLGLGVVAAAWYWLPLLLAGELTHLDPQVLTPGQILARLVMPTDILAMLTGRMPTLSPGTVLGAVPMVLLVVTGFAGSFFMKRRTDDGPLFGLILAVAVLVVLTVVVGNFEVKFLGPVTWRLLYFARVGLALAALPFLGALPGFRKGGMVGLVPVMLAVAYLSSLPLKGHAPDPDCRDMQDLRRVWSWLEENRASEWGRVHLQDTFQLDPGPDGMGASHVLALTARATGVRQVGSAYSIAPYATAPWTASEFSTLFGKFILKPEDVRHVVDKAWFANVTHILTSDSRTAGLLKSSGAFVLLFSSGRFEVLHWQRYGGAWANRYADGGAVVGVDFAPGRIDIPLRVGIPEGIMVKTTYHPFWKTGKGSRAVLSLHPSGLMEVQGLEEVTTTLHLVFRPPWWPRWVTLSAAVGIAFLAWLGRRRRLGTGGAIDH